MKKRAGWAAGIVAMLLAAAVLAQESSTPTPPVPPAQQQKFFRIGTGGTGGTYFTIGGALASAISRPAGAPECERTTRICGVLGLIAVAQATQGSVENVQQIAAGKIESGLVQADIASWAWRGQRMFAPGGRIEKLRAIAALFPENAHIVVPEASPMRTIGDLKGKRVSIGEAESGTLADARLVLGAAGLSEDSFQPSFLRLAQATAAIRNGEIDAFFMIGGAPLPAILDLASAMPIRLLDIPEPLAQQLTGRHRFLVRDEIPGGLYDGIDVPTPTIGTTALWLVSEDAPDALVYAILKTLWQDATQKLLEQRHPLGKRIKLNNAADAIDLPLHPGAMHFYSEAGVPLPPPPEIR
jgi:TRAP transporter TAXI family solute receptor